MDFLRRTAQAIVIMLTLIVGATAAAIIVSQTAWFKDWLRGYIVREANQYLNGQITIERLGGNLFYGIEMERIGVSMDGSEVVSVQDLGLDYSIFELFSKGMSVDDIRLNRPVLYMRHDSDGWSIARLIKRQRQEANREGPQYPISIGDIGISDATVVVDDAVGTSGVNVPRRVDRIDARMAFKYEPVHYSLEISHVSFRGEDPAIGVNALSGGIAVRSDTLFVDKLALRTEESSVSIEGAVQNYLSRPVLHLQISSDKLSMPEIARVVPALAGVKLLPAFELKTAGPLDRLAVEMNVRSSAGQLTGQLVADLMMPGQSVTGDLSAGHLNLAPIVNDPKQKTDLTGNARVQLQAKDFSDLDSVKGQVAIDAPRLVAMNRAVERVHARAGIDGRRLTIDGRASAYGTEATASGTVRLAKGNEPLSYDLRGKAHGLNLERMPADLKMPPAPTSVNAEYHVSGREPGRNPAKAGSHVPQSRELDADLRFDESTVAGATIAGGSTATVSLRGDDVTFQTDLAMSNLDLQRVGREFNVPALADDRYRSSVSGHVAANGAVSGVSNGLTLDDTNVTVRAELQPSQIGDVAIERASIDGDYRERTGDIRQLEIVGHDLNVTASGTLALNDTGASNLTFHADTPNLREVARLANVDVSGIAGIDGHVTGNRTELQAKGTLVGDAVKYGENGALTVSSDYDARVPDLAPERARIVADTKATFVTIAGQNINELSAKTTYVDKELEFDALAKQPERSLAAAGSALLHPDHQEVHLQRLSLDTQGLQWQLTPESQASVRYGDQVVSVTNVTLTSGDQQVTANGSFGRPGNALDVDVKNVDLKSVDALALRPSQFTGRLEASASVTGTTDEPRVAADFQVRQGAFRQFKYDSFGGTIDYAKTRITVDTRLQQNSTQWLTAKGTLPSSLFSGKADRSPLDLTIDSSPIDLGVVQGLTTDLTGVTGMLEAHVRLTGAADDPQPSGAITVKDGAMTVVPSNVRYTNIAGRVDLQPDRVHIDQITVLDNHQAALTVTGDLAIHERQVGGVQLYVTADDFKVVDNKLGNVRIQSRVEINGELRAPRVEGYLGLTTGRLDLDEVLAELGTTPYSTRPTEFVTAPPGKEAQIEPTGVFEALKMDVQLNVPNDFVIRSNNLRTPDSPIGLGALNVTLGGDLRALKDPRGPLQLYGAVNTVRGTYDFQGRRFDILRDGSVRFDGTNVFDPVLNVRTQRVIMGVEAHVNVKGTLSYPEIELTSVPPLPSADILSLIVFNQPINQLAAGQQISLAQHAQALAIGAVAGEILQSIGSALNLDTFDLQLAPEPGQTAELTIGQQVGKDLYVKVQQGVGEFSTTNFVLEYELTRWLRLRTNVLQGSATQQALFRRVQDSGVDLIFFLSY